MNIAKLAKVVFMLSCTVPQLSSADSLCAANETIYFSCSIGNGKIASLCGQAFIKEKSAGEWTEPANPWLQYRFGLPNSLELAYPLIKKGSLEKFEGANGSALQGAVLWQSVSFVNAGIGYKIEYLVPEGREPFEGIRIGKPSKLGISLSARPRHSYPEAVLPCSGKPSHDSNMFDQLSRFLVQSKEQLK